MPVAFLKAIDYTLIGLDETFCFLDDILIIRKRTYGDHTILLRKIFQRIDEENLQIHLGKYHFLQNKKLIG